VRDRRSAGQLAQIDGVAGRNPTVMARHGRRRTGANGAVRGWT